jgi:biotin-dependent carboxylase-like uncharacterized protein
MIEPIIELVNPGLGTSLQDLGRRGWKRYGVPPGGAMDDHAARWANLLLGNPLNAPVLELLLHGAIVRAVGRIEVALTGAGVVGPNARWGTRTLEKDDQLTVPLASSGVWTYLGVRGGFAGPRWFGSVSIFPRGGLGEALCAGGLLYRAPGAATAWPGAVGQRWLDPSEQRDYSQPPLLPVWPGPQWDLFPEPARTAIFEQRWKISARSDRTGYRLEGVPLAELNVSIPSEPVLPGSIQVPPDGIPIVTMRDGPTVGGYPKLGLIDPAHLSWFAQCRPGSEIRFTHAERS